jgi:hypothetical protein
MQPGADSNLHDGFNIQLHRPYLTASVRAAPTTRNESSVTLHTPAPCKKRKERGTLFNTNGIQRPAQGQATRRASPTLKASMNDPAMAYEDISLRPIIVASWTDGKGLQN